MHEMPITTAAKEVAIRQATAFPFFNTVHRENPTSPGFGEPQQIAAELIERRVLALLRPRPMFAMRPLSGAKPTSATVANSNRSIDHAAGRQLSRGCAPRQLYHLSLVVAAPLLLPPQFNFGGSSSLRSVRDAASMDDRSLAKPASVCACKVANICRLEVSILPRTSSTCASSPLPRTSSTCARRRLPANAIRFLARPHRATALCPARTFHTDYRDRPCATELSYFVLELLEQSAQVQRRATRAVAHHWRDGVARAVNCPANDDFGVVTRRTGSAYGTSRSRFSCRAAFALRTK